MIKDYLEVRNSEGMPNLADASIALDFLLSVKNGIQNYAMALTEVSAPQTRVALAKQLQSAIALHHQIADLMMANGWLHPHDLSEQAQMDIQSAQMALQIADLNLFPGNTNRLGNFATPEK